MTVVRGGRKIVPAMVRTARASDVRSIEGFDQILASDPPRRALINRAIEEERALVAEEEGTVVGYGIIDHHFFGRSFLELVYVRESHRNRGWGSRLIEALEQRSRSEKVFTSTNASNAHMQHVLERLGYRRAGIIEGLDEGDPELVYVKRIPGA